MTMKVFVNDKEVDILPGMSVKHAVLAACLLEDTASGKKVYDEWGNETGLDGAVEEGSRIYIR